MLRPDFYIGCAAIGLALSILFPLPVALLLSLPAGVVFSRWYLRRF